MKQNARAPKKKEKVPAFVRRGESAFARVAVKVRAKYQVSNLSLIVWRNGKVAEVPV